MMVYEVYRVFGLVVSGEIRLAKIDCMGRSTESLP